MLRRPLLLGFAIALAAAPAAAGPFDNWFSSGDRGSTRVQSDGTIGDLLARVQRLEGQNRALTGQVQELQNRLRVSLDDSKRYRDDMEYRLQALESGSGKPAPRRSQAAPAPSVADTPPDEDSGQGSGQRSGQDARQGSSQGSGQGAPPSSLGTVAGGESSDTMMDDGGAPPSDFDGADARSDPSAPLDLGQSVGSAPPTTRPRAQTSGLTPPGLPGVAVDTDSQQRPPTGPANQQTASLPGANAAEDEYTADYRLIESRSYEAAELAFRKFLQSYPKDRRAPDATHWVGESLYQRQQYRDAAEQFLKVTTTYGSHRRAPSSMLKLGMSLAALGEKEAACATFQEVSRKYPAASESVKNGVARETQKNGC